MCKPHLRMLIQKSQTFKEMKRRTMFVEGGPCRKAVGRPCLAYVFGVIPVETPEASLFQQAGGL